MSLRSWVAYKINIYIIPYFKINAILFLKFLYLFYLIFMIKYNSNFIVGWFIFMLKYFLVLFISMVPVIELRGAIPYSQAIGLPIFTSYIIAIIGNLIPIPFIYLFSKKILIYGKNKKYIGIFCEKLLSKGHKAGEKILKKSGKNGILIAIAIFIGIPFPGTGAYTGILAASILDIDFKTSFLSAIIGVILSGIIMAIISLGIF